MTLKTNLVRKKYTTLKKVLSLQVVVSQWIKCIEKCKIRIFEDQDATNHDGATAGALLKAFQIGAMPIHIDWIQQGPWASPDEKVLV